MSRYPYMTLCFAFAAWADAVNCVAQGHADWMLPCVVAIALGLIADPATT